MSVACRQSDSLTLLCAHFPCLFSTPLQHKSHEEIKTGQLSCRELPYPWVNYSGPCFSQGKLSGHPEDVVHCKWVIFAFKSRMSPCLGSATWAGLPRPHSLLLTIKSNFLKIAEETLHSGLGDPWKRRVANPSLPWVLHTFICVLWD